MSYTSRHQADRLGTSDRLSRPIVGSSQLPPGSYHGARISQASVKDDALVLVWSTMDGGKHLVSEPLRNDSGHLSYALRQILLHAIPDPVVWEPILTGRWDLLVGVQADIDVRWCGGYTVAHELGRYVAVDSYAQTPLGVSAPTRSEFRSACEVAGLRPAGLRLTRIAGATYAASNIALCMVGAAESSAASRADPGNATGTVTG